MTRRKRTKAIRRIEEAAEIGELAAIVDDRCPVHYGHLQCLDDVDHIADDGGGHHAFDGAAVGLRYPVAVPGRLGLRRLEPVTLLVDDDDVDGRAVREVSA